MLTERPVRASLPPAADFLDPAVPPPGCLAALSRLGFLDAAGALANLRRLAETPELRDQVAPLLPRLLHHLGASPDPDMALNNLERLAAAALDRRGFYTLLAAHPEAIPILTTLAATSQFLADALIRSPQTVPWLLDPTRDADALPRGHARGGRWRVPPVPDRRGAAQRAPAGEAARAVPDRPPGPARGRRSRHDHPGAVGAGRRLPRAGDRDGGARAPRALRPAGPRRGRRHTGADGLLGDRARQARGSRAQLLVRHRPVLRVRGRGRDGRTRGRLESRVLRAPGRAARRRDDRHDGGGHRLPGRPPPPARGRRGTACPPARRLSRLPPDARGPLGAPGAHQGPRGRRGRAGGAGVPRPGARDRLPTRRGARGARRDPGDEEPDRPAPPRARPAGAPRQARCRGHPRHRVPHPGAPAALRRPGSLAPRAQQPARAPPARRARLPLVGGVRGARARLRVPADDRAPPHAPPRAPDAHAAGRSGRAREAGAAPRLSRGPGDGRARVHRRLRPDAPDRSRRIRGVLRRAGTDRVRGAALGGGGRRRRRLRRFGARPAEPPAPLGGAGAGGRPRGRADRAPDAPARHPRRAPDRARSGRGARRAGALRRHRGPADGVPRAARDDARAPRGRAHLLHAVGAARADADRAARAPRCARDRRGRKTPIGSAPVRGVPRVRGPRRG